MDITNYTDYTQYRMKQHGVTYMDLKTHVVIPKITGTISIIGSVYIIQDVLRNPRRRTLSIYHRLMVGISTIDVILSVSQHFLTSWPMPDKYFIFSVGSMQTCDAVGFFVMLSFVGTPTYFCSLATYYLVQLKYNWVDSKIKSIEKLLHAVPWGVGLLSAIIGISTNSYGPIGSQCWITDGYPFDCIKNDDIECKRGGNRLHSFFWISTLIFLCACVAYVSTVMYMVYSSVLDAEKATEGYIFDRLRRRKRKRSRKRSRRVMLQGILYTSSLTFYTITSILFYIHHLVAGIHHNVDHWVDIILPLRGFFTFLIYLTPVFLKMKKERKMLKKGKDAKRAKIQKEQNFKNGLPESVTGESAYDSRIATSEEILKHSIRESTQTRRNSYPSLEENAIELARLSSLKKSMIIQGDVFETIRLELENNIDEENFPRWENKLSQRHSFPFRRSSYYETLWEKERTNLMQSMKFDSIPARRKFFRQWKNHAKGEQILVNRVYGKYDVDDNNDNDSDSDRSNDSFP